MDLFLPSGEVGDTYSQSLDQSLSLGISKRPNRVGSSLHSLDDGNRPNFRNVTFSYI
jgi:hypothetical protein